MKKIIVVLTLLFSSFSPISTSAASTTQDFTAEIWVDNWFALYVNGKKVGEDSTPFNTEKSFNSQSITFKASYPFTIGVIARDYVASDSGLEYIGTSRQQIGDGGFIMQIRDNSSHQIIAGTDKSWNSLVTFKSPTNPECVTSSQPNVDCKSWKSNYPVGWSTSTYNDHLWKSATEYSKEDVGVKEGYFDFQWSSGAQLIWSSDLKLDNTILFRKKILKSPSTSTTAQAFSIKVAGLSSAGNLPKVNTCDGESLNPAISWSSPPVGTRNLVLVMSTPAGPPRNGESATATHFEWVINSLSATSGFIAEGTSRTLKNTLPNFQNRNEYAAPCSQGPGMKYYTFTLYALKSEITFSGSTENFIEIVKTSALGSVALTLGYSRS